MIQHIDHMKLKRKQNQRVDVLDLFVSGNDINKGKRGWEGVGKKRGGEGKKVGQNQVWEEVEDIYRMSGN